MVDYDRAREFNFCGTTLVLDGYRPNGGDYVVQARCVRDGREVPVQFHFAMPYGRITESVADIVDLHHIPAEMLHMVDQPTRELHIALFRQIQAFELSDD